LILTNAMREEILFLMTTGQRNLKRF